MRDGPHLECSPIPLEGLSAGAPIPPTSIGVTSRSQYARQVEVNEYFEVGGRAVVDTVERPLDDGKGVAVNSYTRKTKAKCTSIR